MDFDQKLLKRIQEIDPRGVHGKTLAKTLDIKEEDIPRLLKYLRKVGYVSTIVKEREGELSYWIYPIRTSERGSDITTCPCAYCINLNCCGEGQMVSPEKCQSLFEWVLKETMSFKPSQKRVSSR